MDYLTVIEWYATSRPHRGETESGDAYIVKFLPHSALVVVVDGLGHGRDAAVAARTALRIVDDHALEAPAAIARRCHEALRTTRGAVIALALFDARTDVLTWLGVGNISGYLFRAAAPVRGTCQMLGSTSGVLGERSTRILPLAPVDLTLEPGDTMVIATDGVRWTPEDALVHLDAPRRMAPRLLEGHAREDDDALVLVASYHGVRSVR